MFLKIDLISGFMVGVEFLWDSKILVLDLLIVRLYIGTLNNNNKGATQ
jgi:hypothetical protein